LSSEVGARFWVDVEESADGVRRNRNLAAAIQSHTAAREARIISGFLGIAPSLSGEESARIVGNDRLIEQQVKSH
jgi:hypothetical protein